MKLYIIEHKHKCNVILILNRYYCFMNGKIYVYQHTFSSYTTICLTECHSSKPVTLFYIHLIQKL